MIDKKLSGRKGWIDGYYVQPTSICIYIPLDCTEIAIDLCRLIK